jgi:hypothetical protein
MRPVTNPNQGNTLLVIGYQEGNEQAMDSPTHLFTGGGEK